MSKRKILIIVSCIYLSIAAIGILPAIYTTRETVTNTNVPKTYFIDTADDQIEEQFPNRNAACAVAYVMRYCGDQVQGNVIYADICSYIGTTLPSNLVRYFHNNGYRAKAYHGDLSTLKMRLNEGVPIIVYVRDGKSTHYAVLVGYDENRLYLADPNTDNAYDAGKTYNRVVENEEFQSIWKSGFLVSDHVYIAVKKNAEP